MPNGQGVHPKEGGAEPQALCGLWEGAPSCSKGTGSHWGLKRV